MEGRVRSRLFEFFSAYTALAPSGTAAGSRPLWVLAAGGVGWVKVAKAQALEPSAVRICTSGDTASHYEGAFRRTQCRDDRGCRAPASRAAAESGTDHRYAAPRSAQPRAFHADYGGIVSRLAQKDADTAALLARAARYVGPAESALAALTRQADRLSTYLGPPRQPAAEPIAVNDWLAEVATLLRESTQEVDAKFESTLGDQVSLAADRPRLSHALLRWCLSNADGPVLLSARETRIRSHSDSRHVEALDDRPCRAAVHTGRAGID